jgi:hypothetical protein
MDADAIFTDAMAKFRQQQLDGGMSPDAYDNALLEATIHKAEQLTNKGVKFSDYMRGDPAKAAEDLQAIISAQDESEPADEDLTIDLDDNDGGGE